jgi:hypothetical protein
MLIPAIPEFRVSEKFVETFMIFRSKMIRRVDRGPLIRVIWPEFSEAYKNWVEGPTPGIRISRVRSEITGTHRAVLNYHKLHDEYNLTLGQIFYLLELQGDGSEGILEVSKTANLFTHSRYGVDTSISAYWDGGWVIGIRDVDNPGVWTNGTNLVVPEMALSIGLRAA